mgnify:CR=1 FL=1
MEHINAKEQMIKKNLLKVVRFVDGDGIILKDIISFEKKNMAFAIFRYIKLSGA